MISGPVELLISLLSVVCRDNHNCGICLVGTTYADQTKVPLH